MSNPPLESPIEEAFWMAYQRTKPPVLAGLVPQYSILGRYRLDFALPELQIGIELDGYDYHSSKEAFTNDRKRQRRIETAGWRLLRFAGSEVWDDAEKCVREAAGMVGVLKLWVQTTTPRPAKAEPAAPRSGQPWEGSEDGILLAMHARGRSIQELAEWHGRSPGAIESRLYHLALAGHNVFGPEAA